MGMKSKRMKADSELCLTDCYGYEQHVMTKMFAAIACQHFLPVRVNFCIHLSSAERDTQLGRLNSLSRVAGSEQGYVCQGSNTASSMRVDGRIRCRLKYTLGADKVKRIGAVRRLLKIQDNRSAMEKLFWVLFLILHSQRKSTLSITRSRARLCLLMSQSLNAVKNWSCTWTMCAKKQINCRCSWATWVW